MDEFVKKVLEQKGLPKVTPVVILNAEQLWKDRDGMVAYMVIEEAHILLEELYPDDKSYFNTLLQRYASMA